MGSIELKERFEQQLKEFIQQRHIAELNLNRLDAVIFYIQQELEHLEEGKESDAKNIQED
jgi:hypothetical protein